MTHRHWVGKDRAADLRLRRNYHVSLNNYLRVYKFQGERCAICKRPVPTGKARLAVDHCHQTGLVRGLLCWKCNRALGVWGDDLARLIAAVDYLKKPPFTTVMGRPIFTAPGRVGTKRRAKLLKEMNGQQGRATPHKLPCGKASVRRRVR